MKTLLCLAHTTGAEEKYIHEAFTSNWVVPLGPNVDAFEQQLEHFAGADRHVCALASGTSAIHLALILAGVERGDEVICQSFTFSASANPILYQGAVPVFVDSDPLTWNMDPDLLEKAIADRVEKTGRKPKAIVMVHLYGMPAQTDRIVDIARKYDIPLIEDAAEAMGSDFAGRRCGTFGDFGIWSFNGNKMITTSGGGALICPSEKLKKQALFYATQSREPYPWYQHEKVGYNYRMSNICAGIGRGQMEIVDEHIAHHRNVARRYAELFADTPEVKVHLNPSEEYDSNYWLSTITFENCDINPLDVIAALGAEEIESRLLWKPLHLQPVFADCPAYVNGVSEALFSRGLCLPSGPMVSDDEVVKITNIIKQCVKNL